MKRNLFLAMILMFALVLMMGCSEKEEDNAAANDVGEIDSQVNKMNDGDTLTIDLSGGDTVFVGFEPENLVLEIENKGEIRTYDFIGISLDVLLGSRNITTDFTKIELVVSDMDDNMDITEMAKADAGVFLAWSQSGEPETPFRVLPKDAGTSNLLTKNVTEIIITK